MSHTLYLACSLSLFWFGSCRLPGYLPSCGSVEMIEDDYTTYYDILFLIQLGDNASQSGVPNEIMSALTV